MCSVPSGTSVSGCGRTACGLSTDGRLVVDVLEDLVAAGQVGQAGDAALVGAGAEGHQDLGLAAQQLGHVLLLAVADAAVEQADVDAALSGMLLDVADLGVDGHRPAARCRRPRPPRGSCRRWPGRRSRSRRRRPPSRARASASSLMPAPPSPRRALRPCACTASTRAAVLRPVARPVQRPEGAHFSTMSLMASARCAPSAAEAHCRRRRSSSMPIARSVWRSISKRRIVL